MLATRLARNRAPVANPTHKNTLQLIEFAAVDFETAIDTLSKVLQDPVEQPDIPRFSEVMGRVLG